MRRLLLSALVLVIAGCETQTPETTTTTTEPPAATTTTTEAAPPLALAHALAVGDVLTYDVELERELTLLTEGDPEAPLADLPTSAEVTASSAGTVEFEVTGASENGFLLQVRADLGSTQLEGTVDEEPLEAPSDLRGMGDLFAAPGQLTVDTAGVVSVPTDHGVELLSDPLTRWTGFLGPVLPAEAVAAGQEWALRIGDTRVTGRADRPQRGRVTVTGTSADPPRQTDLSEFYTEFLSAFGETEKAPQLVVEREAEEQRWEAAFEHGEGRLAQSRVSGTAVSRVRGSAPGPAGEEVGFRIRVETNDELRARLAPEG